MNAAGHRDGAAPVVPGGPQHAAVACEEKDITLARLERVPVSRFASYVEIKLVRTCAGLPLQNILDIDRCFHQVPCIRVIGGTVAHGDNTAQYDHGRVAERFIPVDGVFPYVVQPRPPGAGLPDTG